jgi:hypothetical protein
MNELKNLKECQIKKNKLQMNPIFQGNPKFPKKLKL